MPKSFNKSSLGFTSGSKGSTNSLNVNYNVDGNVISGELNSKLNAGEALTVRLTLPEGYFVGASSNIDFYLIFIIVVSLICVLIADRIWAKYGKDDEVIETVEFYPPEGYNSAEVGFLYRGESDTKSVISLLIYLANEGYLKIEETEDTSSKFKITKIKEYDGNDEYEKIFFEGLFKVKETWDYEKYKEIRRQAKESGEKISISEAMNMSTEKNINKTSVTRKDLYNNFYTTLNKIQSKLNSKENKSKIFESANKGKGKWITLLMILLYVIITINPIINDVDYNGQLIVIPILLGVLAIGFIILTAAITSYALEGRIALFFLGGFWSIPWFALSASTITESAMSFITYIIALGCLVILVLFKKFMPKRTAFGNEMLGKLRGFKNFLETAEKPQLESLVEQNPEYFYNILPYTYALGVSDVWIERFETIALQAPSWYNSSSNFDMNSFSTFMTSTMASAQSAMSSSPSSSSSGGGGSSGGGSGGGGGGSW